MMNRLRYPTLHAKLRLASLSAGSARPTEASVPVGKPIVRPTNRSDNQLYPAESSPPAAKSDRPANRPFPSLRNMMRRLYDTCETCLEPDKRVVVGSQAQGVLGRLQAGVSRAAVRSSRVCLNYASCRAARAAGDWLVGVDVEEDGRIAVSEENKGKG